MLSGDKAFADLYAMLDKRRRRGGGRAAGPGRGARAPHTAGLHLLLRYSSCSCGIDVIDVVVIVVVVLLFHPSAVIIVIVAVVVVVVVVVVVGVIVVIEK